MITRMLPEGYFSAASPNGTCERAAAPRAPRNRRRRVIECVIGLSSVGEGPIITTLAPRWQRAGTRFRMTERETLKAPEDSGLT
jgi:hypothetical protein